LLQQNTTSQRALKQTVCQPLPVVESKLNFSGQFFLKVYFIEKDFCEKTCDWRGRRFEDNPVLKWNEPVKRKFHAIGTELF
jgi:hypothetical protein